MCGSASDLSPFAVQVTFHGDLDFFLKKGSARPIKRHLKEKTSVKDIIESCGVPHPGVDLILVDKEPVDFTHVVGKESDVQVYPVTLLRDTYFTENRLQVLKIRNFIADVHLGKLARNLRLFGLNVTYDPTANDRELIARFQVDNADTNLPGRQRPETSTRPETDKDDLQTSRVRNQALLTRDRRLLMHAVVRHGYYLRSQDPMKQTLEVLGRFQLSSSLAPLTRCLRCNALLEPVEKTEIIDRLEPLTKIYYDEFRRCPGCDQLYWRGSHFKKLEARIADLRQQLIFGLCNSSKSA
jgi:uncharacterized protein